MGIFDFFFNEKLKCHSCGKNDALRLYQSSTFREYTDGYIDGYIEYRKRFSSEPSLSWNRMLVEAKERFMLGNKITEFVEKCRFCGETDSYSTRWYWYLGDDRSEPSWFFDKGIREHFRIADREEDKYYHQDYSYVPKPDIDLRSRDKKKFVDEIGHRNWLKGD